ncbi:uncharacterized protein K452DRAFT_284924 [Aplosporella prunicola CBS 121167]|uniref:AA1-like domain-containing protein n=1 Tax=Aplosporella prunicola CBS 121167 TaxID=1176127 RepID=A0A6A6BPV3_9PEZI|nr:uncharacterized protein K452DRAFT_284924 [Aplosporella prunicola CBS 121167]KAF2144601.1 hypothetical protein K452DRAFT_284924 [Aplosporella prunicola CBS 121167]
MLNSVALALMSSAMAVAAPAPAAASATASPPDLTDFTGDLGFLNFTTYSSSAANGFKSIDFDIVYSKTNANIKCTWKKDPADKENEYGVTTCDDGFQLDWGYFENLGTVNYNTTLQGENVHLSGTGTDFNTSEKCGLGGNGRGCSGSGSVEITNIYINSQTFPEPPNNGLGYWDVHFYNLTNSQYNSESQTIRVKYSEQPWPILCTYEKDPAYHGCNDTSLSFETSSGPDRSLTLKQNVKNSNNETVTISGTEPVRGVCSAFNYALTCQDDLRVIPSTAVA